MLQMFDVRDVGCLGCGMLEMSDVGEVRCWGCRMLGFGMILMWDVQNMK